MLIHGGEENPMMETVLFKSTYFLIAAMASLTFVK